MHDEIDDLLGDLLDPESQAGSNASAASTEEEPIINPSTGAIINMESIHHMLVNYSELMDAKEEIEEILLVLRETLWEKTIGETKTRKLEGDGIRATITEGNVSINQSLLNAIRSKYKDLDVSEELFREKTTVKIEVAKRVMDRVLKTQSDNDRFNQMREELQHAFTHAYKPAPTIKIEGR